MDENAIRGYFSEIGCIMEDASVLALVWRANDSLSLVDRLGLLLQANAQITNLLDLIAADVS